MEDHAGGLNSPLGAESNVEITDARAPKLPPIVDQEGIRYYVLTGEGEYGLPVLLTSSQD